MKKEEIRLAAVTAIQEPSELTVGKDVPRLRENIERAMLALVIQAYDEAIAKMCNCLALVDASLRHSEYCPAYEVATLKDALAPSHTHYNEREGEDDRRR